MTGANLFEIIGGAKSGGLLVREGKALASPEAAGRLSHGAVIDVLEVDAEACRVRYELVSGRGPRFGWVTGRKSFMRPCNETAGKASAAGGKNWGTRPGQAKHPIKAHTPTVAMYVRSQNGGGLSLEAAGNIGATSYKSWKPMGKLNSKVVKQELAEVPEAADAEVLVCPQCLLPLGESGYCESQDDAVLHGECRAQLLLRQVSKEEKTRKSRDAESKRSRRMEYDIGWRSDKFPLGTDLACKLGAGHSPHGLYSLVLDETSNVVTVAPTADPAAATNLAYLALALQVRARDGREPLFSLDPKGKTDRASAQWQVKRFEPEWLAGTSVGEVMFQADVHLKELSMGEYVQPVVAMKSCLDCFQGRWGEIEWNAREWFVMRNAEVHMSSNNVLIPRVQMGVEAREQVSGPDGLEDALLTNPEHPMVQYAEAFEHYFDLIAERKSVIYHLRELAKATVLAKFLVDTQARVDEAWLSVVDEKAGDCCMEIPQLWNERHTAQIQVRDGRIVDADKGIGSTKHGLYGGIEFGVDRAMAVPGAVVRPRGPPVTIAKGQITRLPQVGAQLLQSGQEGFSYTPLPEVGVPRGVDLNLGAFDLTGVVHSTEEVASPFPLGGGFFRSLDGLKRAGAFGESDFGLFRGLFHPVLSDRRAEADLFVPPDPRIEYMQKLVGLINEEEATRQQRRTQFVSKDFDMEEAGPLFPTSWKPTHGIETGRASKGNRELRPLEYSSKLDRVLKNATPVFDKTTEDGTKFRIYQVGTLEVRTVQEHDGKERAAAVFSARRARGQADRETSGGEEERVARAVVYVEAVAEAVRAAQLGAAERVTTREGQRESKLQMCDHRFYVVFESEGGSLFLTEKLGSGMAWSENPDDLEARNSLAKVTHTTECHGRGITVADVRRFCEEEASRAEACPSGSAATMYAHCAYSVVLPAMRRSWGALSEGERQAAEQLGLQAAWGQAPGSADDCRRSWGELSESQLEHARCLGFDEAEWGKLVCWVPEQKSWDRLSQGEREAVQVLGVASAAVWDGASREVLRQHVGGAWAQGWAALSQEEMHAAKALGVASAAAWDTACWTTGAAWQRSWVELTEAEREAAVDLGVADEEAWESRKAKVFRAGWQDLSSSQAAAAERLGLDREGWARFL